MTKLTFESPDLTARNITRIEELFPNCVTEALDEERSTPERKVYKKAVNFELLKQMLTPEVIDGEEAYEFTWVGKKAAIVEANKPIRKTLRPCPEESKNWDSTENLYIEGDNLEVLKLLQESYLGKVKMIYIDPPYNTGNDFIYRDDFAMDSEEYAEESGQLDEEGKRLFKNTDSNGRFHSDWCSMIYSRLMLARNLLTDDGVIFISIDDNEQENLKKICDEIFGAPNFVAVFPWRKRTAKSDVPFGVSQDFEWVICYAKSCGFVASTLGNERKYYETPDFPGKPWRIHDLTKQTTASERPNSYFTIVNPKTGEEYPANPNRTWAITEETFQIYYKEKRIVFPGDYEFLNIKKPVLRYWKEDDMQKAGDKFGRVAVSTKFPDDIGMSQDGTKEITNLFVEKIFSFPKPSALIKYLISASTSKDDIILDFFSGSATTAHAVMQLNAEDNGHRKFIMVQLAEPCDKYPEAIKAGYDNICKIGKERIRRAGNKIVEELNRLQKIRMGARNSSEDGQVSWKLGEHTILDGDSEIVSPDSTMLQKVTISSDSYLYEPEKLDIGFRVLKLDDTNMKDVYYSPTDYNQQMLDGLESNIKDDRSDLDLLFGCLLDWGLPLSLPYTSEKIGGFTVHTYNGGDLIACFDENISDAAIKEIAKRQPLRAVFRDSSFNSSPEKINVGEIFKMLAPDTRVKVI